MQNLNVIIYRTHSPYICFVNRQSIKVFGALTLVSILYGANYSILKVATPDYVKPYGFIVIRVISACCFFWLFYAFIREKVDWKADGLRILLCSITGVSTNQLLFFKGISMTSAVNGSIIMTLTPVAVLVWSYFLTKEKITPRKVAGILLGLIGAVIIIYKGDAYRSGNWIGDVLILLNGLLYGCYLVLVKPLMTKYQPLTVVTWIFTVGIVLVLPIGWNEAVQVFQAPIPAKVWWSMGYAILGVTVVAYFLNIWSLIRVNASVVGSFIYLQPIFATINAILFFGEVLLFKHVIASLFVFSGVWLVTKK
ncbi:MAG: DMT family transporter [Bacteroidota bacterium]